MNQIRKQVQRGTRDIDEDDPFELFLSSTSIRYTYYKESEKILGQTFGMLILQDFEALTPNLLARTIETVEGGGIVVLLLKTMDSLKQLYSMSMDVHSRYRTEMHQDVVGRFNERFILSLGDCTSCIVCDDELNVLPLSAGKDVKRIISTEEEVTPTQEELKDLKESLKDTELVGSLINCSKTLDQAKAVLTFVDAIAEKTFNSTVCLTAARGRGKSAALGISLAAAVAYGYSNIFITSPSPENLKTLFEFVFKGFDALGYEEHLDYDILQSSNPDFQKAVVRVNIFRDHRQTIQWILPTDHQVLSQAELLVIDEAAAIPLPVVKKLLGPYLVLMASTINGYEGTGRSLSLKLMKQLREQSTKGEIGEISVGRDGKETKKLEGQKSQLSRSLREITLEEPIRYSQGDPVESWLNKLLCLDCCTPKNKRVQNGCPHPSKCELYYVTRDTLFSYHPVSEQFLHSMMSLYVASHYKNSPNDLQLLSDAPGHHLFVLLAPQESQNTLPEPICVVQICLEGSIAKGSAMASLARGVRNNGDLIPWVVAQQFQDDDFASLSGARVVRIATHPDYIGMGYGKRAMEQLEAYYKGDIVSLNEGVVDEVTAVNDDDIEVNIGNKEYSLKTEKLKVKDPKKMPPLFLKLSERPPKENLQWLGVSYGITQNLHKFWKQCGFSPVYLRQTTNELTGEHTCIMIKELKRENDQLQISNSNWLKLFSWDFRTRFLQLLSFQFKQFPTSLVLGILDACKHNVDNTIIFDSQEEIERCYTMFDLKRLESYAHNVLDYHVIIDLVPSLALNYCLDKFNSPNSEAKLSAVQLAILIGVGLQKKNVEELEKELNLSVSQILAIFAKSVRKFSKYFSNVIENQVGAKIVPKTLQSAPLAKDLNDESKWDPTLKTLEQEQDEMATEVNEEFKKQQRELIDSLDISQYR